MLWTVKLMHNVAEMLVHTLIRNKKNLFPFHDSSNKECRGNLNK